MGHYASEMGDERGPSKVEQTFGAVEDAALQGLARKLHQGFNLGSGLDLLNANAAVTAAEAIDALVRARIAEMLGQATGIVE